MTMTALRRRSGRALRDPARALRRARMRVRGWPRPADLDEMSHREVDAYIRHIGLDARIKTAVANSDARAADADSRVHVG